MKYICQRDCWGYKKRLWKKGDIVDVPAGEEPPAHFSLNEVVLPKKEENQVVAISEMVKAQAPKGGLAIDMAGEVLDQKTWKPRGRPVKAKVENG